MRQRIFSILHDPSCHLVAEYSPAKSPIRRREFLMLKMSPSNLCPAIFQ